MKQHKTQFAILGLIFTMVLCLNIVAVAQMRKAPKAEEPSAAASQQQTAPAQAEQPKAAEQPAAAPAAQQIPAVTDTLENHESRLKNHQERIVALEKQGPQTAPETGSRWPMWLAFLFSAAALIVVVLTTFFGKKKATEEYVDEVKENLWVRVRDTLKKVADIDLEPPLIQPLAPPTAPPAGSGGGAPPHSAIALIIGALVFTGAMMVPKQAQGQQKAQAKAATKIPGGVVLRSWNPMSIAIGDEEDVVLTGSHLDKVNAITFRLGNGTSCLTIASLEKSSGQWKGHVSSKPCGNGDANQWAAPTVELGSGEKIPLDEPQFGLASSDTQAADDMFGQKYVTKAEFVAWKAAQKKRDADQDAKLNAAPKPTAATTAAAPGGPVDPRYVTWDVYNTHVDKETNDMASMANKYSLLSGRVDAVEKGREGLYQGVCTGLDERLHDKKTPKQARPGLQKAFDANNCGQGPTANQPAGQAPAKPPQ